jgi:Domain of unknown function (DUF3943)
VHARCWVFRGMCGLVVSLLQASPAAANDDADYFVDQAGKSRIFEDEYRLWFSSSEPHAIRAGLETALLLGLGTTYYWLDPLTSEDWDDPPVIHKLNGEAVSFDTNRFSTNFILHPLAGAAYYGIGRINGLSVLTSFASAVASSVVWEFALEWREQASVNDMIVTPMSGVSLGEFLVRLGDYVNSSGPNAHWGNVLAAHTIGLPEKLHAWMDGPQRTGLPQDALGFSTAYWHRFATSLGIGEIDNDEHDSSPALSLGAEAELVAIPGFLRPGRFQLGFDQGNFTDGRLRLLFDAGGLAEVDASVSTVPFGSFSQSIERGEGSARLIGLGTGFRYYDSWRLGRRDGYAFVHFPGPVLAVWLRSGSLGLDAGISGSFDFAGIRPLAAPAFLSRFGENEVRSALTMRGYTYAWCASSRARLAVNATRIGIGASAHVGWCRSIQGLDRFDGEEDATSSDSLLELDAWAAFRPPGPVELRLELEHRGRQGEMGREVVERWDQRAAAVAAFVF